MTTQTPIRAALIGAGPLGINIYKYALTRRDINITHVIDIEPALTGKDMGLHSGEESTGIMIHDQISSIADVDVAILATVSDLPRIGPQLLTIIGLGLPVVSTCEELFFPWDTSHDWSETLDLAAKDKGVAVLATGVNPGFLMDSLPMMLSGVCHHIDRVEVRRYQDAQFRRIPFQKKIGAGLSFDEFEERKNAGTLRHVGLTESMHFIAHQLGWKLDRTEDKIEPVAADRNMETASLKIQSGQVAGVRQTGRGFVDGQEKIKLSFQATVGEAESYDEVELFGVPHIRSRIIGGVHGDIATSSIILNACKSVIRAAPGLRTMADVPMVTSIGE